MRSDDSNMVEIFPNTVRRHPELAAFQAKVDGVHTVIAQTSLRTRKEVIYSFPDKCKINVYERHN